MNRAECIVFGVNRGNPPVLYNHVEGFRLFGDIILNYNHKYSHHPHKREMYHLFYNEGLEDRILMFCHTIAVRNSSRVHILPKGRRPRRLSSEQHRMIYPFPDLMILG